MNVSQEQILNQLDRLLGHPGLVQSIKDGDAVASMVARKWLKQQVERQGEKPPPLSTGPAKRDKRRSVKWLLLQSTRYQTRAIDLLTRKLRAARARIKELEDSGKIEP